MKEEYGGYLPFEGHIEKDFFSVYGEENVIRTNSGKAAIYYALKMMDIHSIHVPYYFCGSVFKMIQNTGISIKRYYLDEHLCPVLDNIGEDEGIILGEDDCPCGRKGKYFKILGRLKDAEIRGCSDTYATKY